MTRKGSPPLEARPDPPVFLFAVPWLLATWPSLAIGCLKAFLHAEGIGARCSHFHLEVAAAIGLPRYRVLADAWGPGEALFGALLDPEDGERLVSVAARLLQDAKQPALAEWARERGCDDLRTLVDAWLDRERPERYSVVGGSIGALQLSGTLYVMKRISERGHAGARVVGGAALVGTSARAVLARCPYVDAVVDGEGEHALVEIARRVLNGSPGLAGAPRVVSREAHAPGNGCGDAPTVDLSTSPAPDLEEYFTAAARLGVPKTALTIAFEYSRGCEWEQRTKGQLRGCTFCGLYRNSPDHRRKPVQRAIGQIEDAVRRYQVLNVGLVDAYLPRDYRDELLDGLLRSPADLSLFSELRCDLTRETVERLGFVADRVQLGVESFSSAILRRIGKGVSGAATVHSLRLLQEHGVTTQYNLMTHIPGVTAREIDELNDLMPALFGLAPPSITEFYLDRNSLVYADPAAHGIDPATLDAEGHEWLARALGDSRISQVVPFRAVDPDAEAAWNRVRAQARRWRERWNAVRAGTLAAPLTWQQGSGWATVVDARTEVMHIYRLEGVLHDVFLACGDVTSMNGLVEALPAYSKEAIEEALRELTGKRLVLQDGRLWVALPVRARARDTLRASIASRSFEPATRTPTPVRETFAFVELHHRRPQ